MFILWRIPDLHFIVIFGAMYIFWGYGERIFSADVVFSVFVCFVCVEEMKQNYGVTL